MSTPTDITNMLLQSQAVVDSAVTAASETRKTQDLLEQHILITDTKIGVHNVDTESHPDIRERLAEMPAMITDPIVTGVSAVESGSSGTWTIYASPIVPTVTLDHFEVQHMDGTVTNVPADASGYGDYTATFEGEDDSTGYFLVTGVSTNNFRSNTIRFELTITRHYAPDVTGFTSTLPDVISYGKTYTYRLSGITDVDGDISNIAISADNSKITFNRNTGLSQNTDYTFTVDSSYVGPGTCTFTVTVTDEFGFVSTAQHTARVNRSPVTSGIAHNLPNNLVAGSSNTVRVSGITDPDGDSVTYNISSSIASISFSKTSGIALNEDITVTVDSGVAVGTAYNIVMTFVDQYGATATYTESSTINTPPNMNNFVCTQEDFHKPGASTAISFSGATDVNDGSVTYSITNTNSVLSFSKTSSIGEDEEIVCTVSGSAVRGSTYAITVKAIDSMGSSTSRTVNIQINRLPVVANITHNVPGICKPNATYTARISGATDADGQTLKYTITSDNTNVTITGGNNISANTNFTFKTPTVAQLARGRTFNLIVTVSDGLETSSTTIPVQINRVPDISNVSMDLPSAIYGGSENAVSVAINGATDADNHTFTYTINNVPSGLRFSKTTGITDGEALTMTATKVTSTTNYTVNIVATDSMGEVCSGNKAVTITVSPIIVTAPPTFLYPTDGVENCPHYEGFTMQWGAYTTMSWTGNGTYPND